jgi:hypothetical protein
MAFGFRPPVDALGGITNMTPGVPVDEPPPKRSYDNIPLSKEDRAALEAHDAFMAPANREVKRLTEATGDLPVLEKQNELERQARQAERSADARRQEATSIEESEANKKLQAMVVPEFIPTQENSKDLANLFGLISVIGFTIGMGGKRHAMQAMSAMNGMLEGHRAGREDLYKREKGIFEEQMKSLKQKSDLLTKELERIIRLAATNREAAEEDAMALFAQEGADFYKKHAEQYGLLKTLELAKATQKNQEEAYKAMLQEKTRREAAEARLAQSREANDLRRALAARQSKVIGQDEKGNLLVQHGDGTFEKVSGLGKIEKLGGSGGAKASANNQRYAFNMTEAFGQASRDLLNVTMLPANTTLGAFAGMTGKSGEGLLSSLTNSFARSVTPDDERAMQQLISALDFNMSRTLGGGYASSSTKSILDSYRSQVAQFGDSPMAQALFLARMKQELKVFREVFDTHPGSDDKKLAVMDNYIGELDRVIPFEVGDVIAANRGSKETMTENLKNMYQAPSSIVLPTDPASAPAPAPAPAAQTATGATDFKKLAEKQGWTYDPNQWEYKLDPNTGEVLRRKRK